MAALCPASGKLLAVLLSRDIDSPTAWARDVVLSMPRPVRSLEESPSLTNSLNTTAERQPRPKWPDNNHWLLQSEVDAQRAAREWGLPDHITAALMAQLPSPTCTHAELQAAVQHPSVTRPLLQHLRRATEDGSTPAFQHWEREVFQAVLCEAAWLADEPMLDILAAGLLQLLAHPPEELEWVAADEQEYHHSWWDWEEDAREAACAALKSAASSGSLAVLRLACMPPSVHVAWPTTQLLQRGVGDFAVAAAQCGQVEAVQLLLDEAAQPLLDTCALLCAALAGRQLPVFHLVVGRLGLPADTAPVLLAAIGNDQPEVVLQIVAQGGLPANPRPLLMAAIAKGQPAVVRLVLERSGLVPGAAELCAAIRVPSPAYVRLLLAAADGPVEVPPPAGVLDLSHPTESRAAYTCPVLVTLQERIRTDRPAPMAGKLMLIMEALQGAGYRPAVYCSVRLRYHAHGPVLHRARFDPIAEDAGLHLQSTNRFLWLALQRPEWSPDNHHLFMPRFKRAVRALLLAAHRGRPGGAAASHGGGHGVNSALLQHLAALPSELLLEMVGQAAYPLSAWAPGVQE